MSESSKPTRLEVMRPDVELAGVASDAWEAFNAMETTKRRHYELLEILDNKKKNYNLEPSMREQNLLSCLLKDHDEQVKRFTQASLQLKQHNAAAHMTLFKYISSLSELDQELPVKH